MKTSGQSPAKLKWRLEPNWKLLLFAALFLPVLVGLGFWQLERAEEKRTIQESWRQQQALPALPLSAVNAGEIEGFRRVQVSGEFDPEHYWLVENQIQNGHLGYWVVMPFLVADAPQTILVNRGWVAATAYRDEVPEVTTPLGVQSITGSLVAPSDNRMIDEAMPEERQSWPRRLLQEDPESMGAQLLAAGYQQMPLPRVLRLDPDSPGALQVNWHPVNMQPATHTGYAVQWFALALALVILSVFANTNLAQLLNAWIRKDSHKGSS